MYVSPILRPVSGLAQALALNAAELDNKQQFAQLHALKKDVPFGRGPAELAPQAYDPHPEAAAWQRNVAGFLQRLHTVASSANPYNDHRFFTHAPVLSSGWAEAPEAARFTALNNGWANAADVARALVAPGRSDSGPHNAALVNRFRLLLEVSGFDKRFPVLLDRNGLLLDGWHRLLACAQTGQRYFFLQLDF